MYSSVNAIKERRTLRQLRMSLGWTQAELARRAGIDPVSICKYERGARVPSLPNLQRLAAQLGVTLDDIQIGSAA